MILLIKALSTGFYAENMAVGDTYAKQTPIRGDNYRTLVLFFRDVIGER
jgi:hypothetical protein